MSAGHNLWIVTKCTYQDWFVDLIIRIKPFGLVLGSITATRIVIIKVRSQPPSGLIIPLIIRPEVIIQHEKAWLSPDNQALHHVSPNFSNFADDSLDQTVNRIKIIPYDSTLLMQGTQYPTYDFVMPQFYHWWSSSFECPASRTLTLHRRRLFESHTCSSWESCQTRDDETHCSEGEESDGGEHV